MPDDVAYADLDTDAQVAMLRPIALQGAEQLGLRPTAVELAHHGYNTTFRVGTADGVDHAVRVLTNSHSTAPQLEAQHAWMHAIARDGAVVVPDPVTGPDGATHAVVPGDALGRAAVVVAASWLPGADVGTVSLEHAHELGVTMAALHDHAEGWSPPAGTELTTFDDPLFGDEDALSGLRDELGPGGAAVVEESLARCRAAFAEACAGPLIPLHADLHGGNLKWFEGRLAVFDFDDCGIGPPVLDLAISAFYLRGDAPGVEAGMREGYQALRSLPEVPPETFEAVVASRQLLLANALLASSTASLRAEAASYLRVTVDRLRHWLAHGWFTRQPPPP